MATAYGERTSSFGGSMRRISWGAIIAGTVIVLALQIMFGLLGLSIGLTVIDPASNDTPSAMTLLSAGGVWALIIVLVSSFAGGWTAAWLAGSLSHIIGALHGVVTWATSTLLAVWLLANGATTVASGALGAFESVIAGAGQTVGALAPRPMAALPDDLERQARELFEPAPGQDPAAQPGAQGQQAARNPNGTPAIDEVISAVQEDGSPQDRQAVIGAIAEQAGISDQEAAERLQQFQTAYAQGMNQAAEMAERTAGALAGTAFSTFVMLLLGLVAGGGGGWLGKPPHPLAEAF